MELNKTKSQNKKFLMIIQKYFKGNFFFLQKIIFEEKEYHAVANWNLQRFLQLKLSQTSLHS